MTILILQGTRLDARGAREVADAVGGQPEEHRDHWRIATDAPVDNTRLAPLRERAPFDINCIPPGFRPAEAALFLTDMDSTLIRIECADELGTFAGVRDEVAEITQAAMRGDIDFPTSLRRRLALLQGLPVATLDQVYEERLELSDGADALIAGLQERGIRTALVSGGFTYFTSRLQQRLGLDYTLANELEIEDGRLLGTVSGEIVGAQAKADFLHRLCEELGIEPSATIAAGDGANDLPMIRAAGLGVAFRAKPSTQAAADVVLDHAGLDAILAFLDP